MVELRASNEANHRDNIVEMLVKGGSKHRGT